MEKKSIWRVIVAAVIYLALFVLGATSGLLGPYVYAYAGTILPLLFAFVYLYTAANMRCFGAALALNGFVLVMSLIAGEGNPALIIGMIIFTVLAEVIRMIIGCESLKGVRFSFIPFAFSFYAYSGHWWTDKQGTYEAAVEEMSTEYAEKIMEVVNNIPLLIVMLILVIPVSFLGILLAEKVMKKETARLSD